MCEKQIQPREPRQPLFAQYDKIQSVYGVEVEIFEGAHPEVPRSGMNVCYLRVDGELHRYNQGGVSVYRDFSQARFAAKYIRRV
jgi:hypothetical protein